MASRCALSFAVVLFLAAPSGAAPISQISWDVTGGSFSSVQRARGRVSGRTLTWTPQAGSISTSATIFALGQLHLYATGPSGVLSFSNPSFGLSVFPGAGASASAFTAVQWYTGRRFPPSVPTGVRYFHKITINGTTGLVSGLGRTVGFFLFNHVINVGNEVRTVVPEPATGTLFALGLLGLGAAGARARRGRA